MSWRCGLSPSAAGEQLRVAYALEVLPVVRGAFAAGRISFSQAHALSRVATPENEAALVDTATACAASQLDRFCAGIARARSNDEVVGQAARASSSSRWEPDGSLRFSGRLSAEDGATPLAALAAVRPDPVDPADPAVASVSGDAPGDTAAGEAAPGRDGDNTPQGVHRPDAAAAVAVAHSDAAALVPLAEHALSDPPPAVGASAVRLVIHAAADACSGTAASPSAEGPDGPALPSVEGSALAVLDAGPGIPLIPLGPDTLRRLACEALVEPATHPDTEATAAVQHRFATARQRRALLARDAGCAFAGCRRRRGLHAHYLLPWREGGPTTIHNLLLGNRHHHAVHDGGWSVALHGDGTAVWASPTGQTVTPPPNSTRCRCPHPNPVSTTTTPTGTGSGPATSSSTNPHPSPNRRRPSSRLQRRRRPDRLTSHRSEVRARNTQDTAGGAKRTGTAGGPATHG